MTRRTNRSRWVVGITTVALLLAPAVAALLAFLALAPLVPIDDAPPPAHWTTAGSP